VADLLPVMLAAVEARPRDEAPLLSILAALRTLIGPDGPPELAQSLAGPVNGIRARIGLFRVLSHWEQGIADTLLARWDVDPATAPDRLRQQAAVIAAAATSALRNSAQLYRERYPGNSLDTARLLPIVADAFAVLASGCPAPPR
jgi:hypothetical protein